MIKNYEAVCKCGFKARLKYGREGKNEVEEIFSCPKCQNLFTLAFTDTLKCKCGNTELISYNPNKEDNLAYYKKMAKDNMLLNSKLKELEEFWNKVKDNECPKCNKDTLRWNILN